MTLFFTGGAFGTLLGIFSWHFGGWNWVMAQMFLFSLGIVFLLWKEMKENTTA
jgi:hypothetical protein